DQHANDRSFYFTNIFTAQWMREKNPALPEGFLWRMIKTKNLGYPFSTDRLNLLWSTYRLRSLDAPERRYWDEYTDVMKDSYGIGYDFAGYFAYLPPPQGMGAPLLALWCFNNALKYRQPQTLGRIYMMLGETYMALRNYPAAVNNYQESLKRDPRNPGVPYILARMGDAFRIMNDYANADAAYHQALSFNPQQKEALDGLQLLNSGKRELPKGAQGTTRP
ncbi:MAG TPA: tetratricopeptide repeat protein, partial [bacterium]|nr:tetratricopeptide repeat protein [bacterium]